MVERTALVMALSSCLAKLGMVEVQCYCHGWSRGGTFGFLEARDSRETCDSV